MKRKKEKLYLIGAFVAGMIVMAFAASYNPFNKIMEKDNAIHTLNRIGVDSFKETVQDHSEIIEIHYIADGYYDVTTENSNYIIRMARAFREEDQGMHVEYFSENSGTWMGTKRVGIEKLPIWDWLLPVPESFKQPGTLPVHQDTFIGKIERIDEYTLVVTGASRDYNPLRFQIWNSADILSESGKALNFEDLSSGQIVELTVHTKDGSPELLEDSPYLLIPKQVIIKENHK